jgi:hypothetical protein
MSARPVAPAARLAVLLPSPESVRGATSRVNRPQSEPNHVCVQAPSYHQEVGGMVASHRS